MKELNDHGSSDWNSARQEAPCQWQVLGPWSPRQFESATLKLVLVLRLLLVLARGGSPDLRTPQPPGSPTNNLGHAKIIVFQLIIRQELLAFQVA